MINNYSFLDWFNEIYPYHEITDSDIENYCTSDSDDDTEIIYQQPKPDDEIEETNTTRIVYQQKSETKGRYSIISIQYLEPIDIVNLCCPLVDLTDSDLDTYTTSSDISDTDSD